MSKTIILSVTAGMLAGYFFVPDSWVFICEYLIKGGLCAILFLVGLDIGRQENVWKEIREVGFWIFLFPLAIIVGTLAFGALSGLFLPMTIQEAVGVAAGLGWYSLAPMMLAEYSATLSATAFLANVFREIGGIIFVAFVADKVGFIESIAVPGSSSMDTCLPVIVSATNDRVAIYSIVSGVVISISIPFLIQIVMGF
ncbi:lysine exporter LysO family protein [Sinanaerobacter sp. ZZT-01]|uniref:lysine exporter LysO family protein n=1 Tax=Sinanaerobacter sp. ZZT-01 TaxID=3111540 RepID=UPI002D7740E9|nr:lysine exporter LysO family protein [Sinanaerobacter sp. ZZT-01]WRR92595.1 lysine exporter LysO family protein [Sinanaerobacter sp. ZZT-01]